MANSDGPRTRRAVLAGAAGAAGAAAVAAVTRPMAALAANGGNVILGQSNNETLETSITNSTAGANTVALYGSSTASYHQTLYVGSSGPGTGVYGGSSEGTGVFGVGPVGVFGDDGGAANGIAVDGKSFGTNGTGIRGWATAVAGTTVGVVGRSDSPSGFALLARNTAGGTALEADGKIRFKRSGKTTMAAGTSSRKVTLSGVSTSSMVFAVLASSRSGRWVRAVVPGSGYFTIYLNTTVLSSTSVSWFVLDPFI
jgi:hypothetical protein